MRTATIMLVAALLLVSSMAMANPKEKEFVAPIEGTKGLLDCTNAIPISCGDVYQGTTVGGNTDVSAYSCVGWTESGPEVVFELALAPPSTYNVTAVITPDGCDLDVFFLGSCDEDDCLDYGDTSVTVDDLVAGTYYIVVDGYSGAECAFEIGRASCRERV